MGDVASGNDGFLSGYKFVVQLKFGDSSLLSLQVFLKILLEKRPDWMFFGLLAKI